MATEDQTVPVDFGSGIDQKTDPKQVLVTQMTRLENRVFSKTKQLKKDFGFDRLTNETIDGGTITAGHHQTRFDDELLTLGTTSGGTGKRLCAYSESAAKWIDRGSLTDKSVLISDILRNGASQSNCEVEVAGNYAVYAWKDSRGGIRYSVKDLQRNVFIVSDDSVSSTGYFVRLLKLNSTTIAFYYNSTSNINYKTWTTTAPSAISGESTFVGSLSSTIPNTFDVYTDGTSPVMAYWNANAASERIFVAKINTTTGALSSSADVLPSVTDLNSLAVTLDSSGTYVFVIFSDANAGEINGLSVLYSSLALVGNTFLDSSMEQSNFVPVSVISTAANTCTVIYSRKNTTGISQPFSTYMVTLSNLAVAGSVALLHVGTCIYSKPVSMNGEAHIVLQNYDDHERRATQPTYFLIRISDGFVSSRFLTNEAGDGVLGIISELSSAQDFYNSYRGQAAAVASVSSSRWLLAAQILGDFSADLAGEPVIVFNVAEASIEIPSVLSLSSAQANRELLLSGGVTSSYDGDRVHESGFHKGPDAYVVDQGTSKTSDHFALAVTNGTAGTPEVFTITVNCSAELIEPGAYFTFTTSSGNYYVLFSKSGLRGTDPAIGGATKIDVDIQIDFDKYRIAGALYTALQAATGSTKTQTANVVTVTNTANGNVTSAVNVSVANGLIAAGTYFYRGVFEYRDAAGNINVSPAQQFYENLNNSPSRKASIAKSGTGHISVNYCNLSLTEKDATAVSLKIYRTTNGGSIYYLVNQIIYPTLNDPTNVTLGTTGSSFDDVLSDTAIVGRDVIYTSGGVLNNAPPPASSSIIVSKDRAWILDVEADRAWPSKILDEGFASEFAEDLAISIDAKGDDLVAIGEMDDKVILFKEDQPYYVFGDGPGDTGAGQSFNVPEPIISPVGASEKNSVIKSPIGLMFKSLKGIYLMGRDLATAFIGAPVEDFNSSTVYSADILPDLAQIRFLISSDKYLIYDYDMQQWSSRTTQSTPVDAVIWKNKYTYLQSNGRVWVQNTGYQDNSTNVITLCETGWLNLNGLQGFQRVKRLILLGEYKSAHTVTVDVGYDYATSYDTTNNRYTFTPSGSAGDPLQFEIHLKQQKCEAIRIRITEGAVAGTLLEGNSWAHMQLIVGLKKGVNKLPATKKV